MPDTDGGKVLVDPQVIPDWIRHGLPAQPPSHEPEQSPARCYRINHDYIPFLIALCDYYIWPDAFEGDLDTRRLAANRFANLQLLLMAGNVACGSEEGMEFRQDDDNPCRLEYSTDGGTTWKLMFDFSLCFAEHTGGYPVPDVTVQNQINLQINNWLNLYDGTTGSVAPNMVHQADGKNDERDLAVCAGLYQMLLYIRSLAINKPKHHQGFIWDFWRLMDDLANLGFDILFWIGDELIPNWTIADEILITTGKRLQKNITEFLEGYDITPLQDEAVIARLLCYAYSTVDGATVTWNEFSHMFDGCAVVPGMTGSAQDFLVKLVDDEEYFAEFVAAINDFVDPLAAGTIVYDCPCDEWEKVFDFAVDNGGWVTYVHDNMWTDPDPPPKGIYNGAGTPPGWYTEAWGATAKHLTIHRGLGGQYDITYLKAEFEQLAGAKTSYQSNVSLGLAEWGEYKAATENSGAVLLEWQGIPTPATCLIFETSFNGNSSTVLKKLTVRGIGNQPVW